MHKKLGENPQIITSYDNLKIRTKILYCYSLGCCMGKWKPMLMGQLYIM